MEIQHVQRTQISRRHLLIKFAYVPAIATIAIPLMAMKQSSSSQNNWRWCSKCEGLWFAGHATHGVCAADRQAHIFDGSGDYTLLIDTDSTASAQNNWRWCHKCEGLWFAGEATHGVCPADGDEHSLVGSGDYTLSFNLAIGQDNWRWCHKCEALWFAGHGTHGVCAADGGEHSRLGSGDYVLASL